MTRILGVLCFLIFIGILAAGLSPFRAPRNAVTWETDASGLVIGKYGSIVSANPFKPNAKPNDGVSLQIWLQPQRIHSSGTILAFYEPESKNTAFALRQSLGDVVLQRPSKRHSREKRSRLYVDDVFNQPRPVLITITSEPEDTAIYADGALLKKSTNFTLSSADLAGRLIIGNSPVTTDNWSGAIHGLALYHRALTAAEVSEHAADWADGKIEPFAQGHAASALYLFNEAGGAVVHNRLDSSTDLLIPEKFFLLHEQFLERPWHEYRRDWNYWKDVAINIGGFIPFGFLFCAYFQSAGRIKHAALLTVILGFAVSLTIEVGQSFLPTRNSGMTDLFTNTLGTFLGVCVFRSLFRNIVSAMTKSSVTRAHAGKPQQHGA
jgi:VanZ family protein